MIDRLEARLGEKPRVREAPLAPAPKSEATVLLDDVPELVPTLEPALPDEGGSSANWPDESAEASFLAEARQRGEPVIATQAKEDNAEETDPKTLPPLDDLVQRIPTEVRDVLEDLFRARFVSVKRLPKKALKT